MTGYAPLKKVVITGASGFLGSHLLARLAADPAYEVHALTGQTESLRGCCDQSGVYVYDKSVIDTEEAGTILKDALVFSCAYPRNIKGPAMADGLRYVQKVFLKSFQSEAAGLINISSQSVYSSLRNEPAVEEMPVSPETTYAVGKYTLELMLEALGAEYGMPYTSIRMASLIGPGFNQRIVNRFVAQGLETGAITVYDNQKRFGFLDVEDAVSALACLTEGDPAEWKPVYNLGRKESYSLKEIADSVRKVLRETDGIDLQIEVLPGEGEQESAVNAALFSRQFGFGPSVTLEESIARIREDYEKS